MAKMRSPNYPAIGLSTAVELTNKLWKKEHKTPVNAAVVASAIGYKGLSGPSRTAIAAMKKFGLLDEDKNGMRVSNLAVGILHPSGDDDRLEALRHAAMMPTVFRQLFESHGQASNDALRSYLITKLDFSETGAKAFIEAFRDTIAIAKLDEPGYIVADSSGGTKDMEAGLQIGSGEVRTATTTKALKSFSWPLSAATTARLEIVGNEELTSAHLDALSQYLEVAKKLLKITKKES
jgi:hypothetical protein